jgi:hypothetical protein
MDSQEERIIDALLDCLNGWLPLPSPEEDAYAPLRERARALVQAAAAARPSAPSTEPPPLPAASLLPSPQEEDFALREHVFSMVRANSGMVPSNPPSADGPAPDPAADAPATSAPLRPGQIPNAPLLPAPPPPMPLVVEIAHNARDGEPYRSPIMVHTADGCALAILACDIPPAAGVAFEDGCLVADDPHAGEYALRLTCALENQGSPPTLADACLVVNPNPRTLWQNLPSDRDAPGWKPDTDRLEIPGSGGRRLIAASRRGRSHAHKGGFRDDDFALHVGAAQGWNLMAVTDGAGSAARSRIGSRVAAQTAVAIAAQKLEAAPDAWPIAAIEANPSELAGGRAAAYATLGAAAFEALREIETKAREHGCDARDYATTLLLLAHRPIEGGELVASFWVGDGAIAAIDATDGVRLLGQPDSGEFAGQTRFLDRAVMADGAEIMRRIHVDAVAHFDALMLMTDGVSDPRFPSEAALREREPWERLWEELAPLIAQADAAERLVDWLDFWSPQYHDDRTLAVIR